MSQRPVALITGATGGLGQVLAPVLAADGYDLALFGSHAERLEALGLTTSIRQTFEDLVFHTPYADTRMRLPWTFSTFDYPEQGLLYCATHLPEPRHHDARAAIRNEIVELIEAAGGRTLALFTSASAMNEAADSLAQNKPSGLE